MIGLGGCRLRLTEDQVVEVQGVRVEKVAPVRSAPAPAPKHVERLLGVCARAQQT
jgi:hypothetical protein